MASYMAAKKPMAKAAGKNRGMLMAEHTVKAAAKGNKVLGKKK